MLLSRRPRIPWGPNPGTSGRTEIQSRAKSSYTEGLRSACAQTAAEREKDITLPSVQLDFGLEEDMPISAIGARAYLIGLGLVSLYFLGAFLNFRSS